VTTDAHTSDPCDPPRPITRLLVVVDAAVAGADDLPPDARDLIHAAHDVYVVTPSLPGRLDWLTNDTGRSRQSAEERLKVVLQHMRLLGARATGTIGDDSTLTAFADAVAKFHPDHIMVALRSSEHANWQERRLARHVKERFALPLTAYVVDPRGHVKSKEPRMQPNPDQPVIVCFDGSEDAKYAVRYAGGLLSGRKALVLTVWEPTALLSTFGLAGVGDGVNFVEIDHAAAESAERVAADGARIARDAGFDAEPAAIKATGPVWKMILDSAEGNDVAAIVIGSRGLGAMGRIFMGSVSNAVVHHADRPTLVIHHPSASDAD
jgi:nucleotide-binding universal stress UspA family protein